MNAGRYNDAILEFRHAVTLDPGASAARLMLAISYALQGSKGQALAECDTLDQTYGESDIAGYFLRNFDGYLGFVYGASGRADMAAKILARMWDQARQGYYDPYMFALVHAGVGDHDAVLVALDQALEVRSASLVYMKCDACFKELHSDLRFTAIMRAVGVPG